MLFIWCLMSNSPNQTQGTAKGVLHIIIKCSKNAQQLFLKVMPLNNLYAKQHVTQLHSPARGCYDSYAPNTKRKVIQNFVPTNMCKLFIHV